MLSEVVLSETSGEDGPPARLTLSACLHLADDDVRPARWLLAESSWADVFTTPRFLGIARWIWKVSTCMLVMQFFIPMRRHWRNGSQLIAAVYLLLMGAASILSTLFSVLLLALALAAYLPIPRIDKAVRWVVVSISAVLGDTYMLAHCPVQFAAMRSRVTRDLGWLQEHCDKVAIIAHSQGSAIIHRVLEEGTYRRDGSLKALITLGQSITKFDMLERMDWEMCERTAARQIRWLVTLGMICAGLPAFSFVASRWVGVSALKTPA
ncbi:MAG TPA: hypothetical protein VKU60_10750, partial [Chloroflexota bacterium]|nr:hypothetical protein [Chloroflexota bacterium]